MNSLSREALLSRIREGLASALPEFLLNRRWFGGKARTIRSVDVSDLVLLESAPVEAFLAVVRVGYAAGPSEAYAVPLIATQSSESIPGDASYLTLNSVGQSEPVLLYDAMADESFLEFLLHAIAREQSFSGADGKVIAARTTALSKLWSPPDERLAPALMNAEQSNTSVIFGKRLVLKLFRRLEEGINPDVEIGTFLTERARFRNSPAVAGFLEYAGNGRPACSLGILQAFVTNEGDAWKLTLTALADYYRHAGEFEIRSDEIPRASLFERVGEPIPDHVKKRLGDYLPLAELLARRTAELHLALSSGSNDPEFSPEPFRLDDAQVLCDSALHLLNQTMALLREKKPGLPASMQESAHRVLALEENAQQSLRALRNLKTTAMRARIHGDYHLGQVLFTGKDFMIIDFEGEPARSLRERRAKRSPLQDVAGMLRSFHYAAYAPLLGESTASSSNPQVLSQGARYWQAWVCRAFLKTYLEVSGGAAYIPRDAKELESLLSAYLLDKAIYELKYELNNRPHWVRIPLEGITHLLSAEN